MPLSSLGAEACQLSPDQSWSESGLGTLGLYRLFEVRHVQIGDECIV